MLKGPTSLTRHRALTQDTTQAQLGQIDEAHKTLIIFYQRKVDHNMTNKLSHNLHSR